MSRNDHRHTVYTREDFKERVLTVTLQRPEQSDDTIRSSLEELQRLIETLGGKVVETCVQKRTKPSPATFIGRGKAEELKKSVKEHRCTLVAFDDELTGGQQRNLEKLMDCRVVDRTGVILDIFQRHARTKEAKNQVELASLEYLSTHLTRRWTHLERQRGGIGLRGGVGEKQIELDRRMIRDRMIRLKAKIKHTTEERSTQRMMRDRFLRVALVGYTNAGKSTLMNRLTPADVYVDDRLFATLDSTVRLIDPRTRPPILLSDTVGFIDKLPHSLVASFRSTLLEVLEADLLLHVVDLSSDQYMDQFETTKSVLEEIGAADKPVLLVFNKKDLVSHVFLPKILERRYIDSVAVSAFDENDMVRLRNIIYEYFERDMVEMEVLIPYEQSQLQSQIHEHSKVLEKKYFAEGAQFKIRIMKSTASWLRLKPVEGASP